MNEFFYRKLDAYQLAKEVALKAYKVAEKLPPYEMYALGNQMRRSAVSIPSNIAEGMGRVSMKERLHFVEIAYGSLTELLCQMEIAQSLNYITSEDFSLQEELIARTAKIFSGLRKSIQTKISVI